MAEEKVLDMNGIKEDAEAAERETEAAKLEPDIGSYTHTFKNPFRWKDRTFESLTFAWSVLSGRDYLSIEDEITLKGRTLVIPAYTGDFLAGMAARACTERDENGRRVIDWQAVLEMPLTDFQTITRKARGFLLHAE